MCKVVKIEKRCFTENFDLCTRQICRTTCIRFHKENEKGKEKEVFQGEGIQKVVVQLPYKLGYFDNK